MNLLDFLLARTVEDLRKQRCDFEQERNGDLRCLCKKPSPEVDTLFHQVMLIRECSEIPSREFVLRLLADRYATHPEYRPEWHCINDGQSHAGDEPVSRQPPVASVLNHRLAKIGRRPLEQGRAE
jgi:hypothetical protein